MLSPLAAGRVSAWRGLRRQHLLANPLLLLLKFGDRGKQFFGLCLELLCVFHLPIRSHGELRLARLAFRETFLVAIAFRKSTLVRCSCLKVNELAAEPRERNQKGAIHAEPQSGTGGTRQAQSGRSGNESRCGVGRVPGSGTGWGFMCASRHERALQRVPVGSVSLTSRTAGNTAVPDRTSAWRTRRRSSRLARRPARGAWDAAATSGQRLPRPTTRGRRSAGCAAHGSKIYFRGQGGICKSPNRFRPGTSFHSSDNCRPAPDPPLPTTINALAVAPTSVPRSNAPILEESAVCVPGGDNPWTTPAACLGHLGMVPVWFCPKSDQTAAGKERPAGALVFPVSQPVPFRSKSLS